MKTKVFFALICSLSLPIKPADTNLATEAEATHILEAINNHESRPERLYLALTLTCELWAKLLSGPRFTLEIPNSMLTEDTSLDAELSEAIGVLELSPEALAVTIQFRAFNVVCNLWDSIPRLAPLKQSLLEQFETLFNQPPVDKQIAKFQFCDHTAAVFFKPIQKISPARLTELNLVLQGIEQKLYEHFTPSTTP